MSTGGRTILGPISKRGNRYLRMLFVQAARAVLLRPQSWEKRCKTVLSRAYRFLLQRTAGPYIGVNRIDSAISALRPLMLQERRQSAGDFEPANCMWR
jgi:hypothetical protein